jgi:hypothetical protein
MASSQMMRVLVQAMGLSVVVGDAIGHGDLRYGEAHGYGYSQTSTATHHHHQRPHNNNANPKAGDYNPPRKPRTTRTTTRVLNAKARRSMTGVCRWSMTGVCR